MKNKIMKFKLLVIVFIIFVISNHPIFAHPTNQSGIIEWGELCGWSIIENCHSQSTSTTYKFDPNDRNMSDTYKNIIRSGASKWSSYGNISESSSGIGTIHTYEVPNDSIIALFYDQYANSSGHLTFWKIKLLRMSRASM